MKQNRLIIIGAGGHGKVVADIARHCGYTDIAFLDDAEIPGRLGSTSDYIKYIDTAVFFVAIGNSRIREKVQSAISNDGGRTVTLIHPNAVVGDNVSIGKGSAVMAGAVVNPGVSIGDGVIINTCSSVDHDCTVGDYCHISVGAHIAGTVNLGRHTMIGAGAIVINNIDICDSCTVGAGAVVVRNIADSGVYKGIPARMTKA